MCVSTSFWLGSFAPMKFNVCTTLACRRACRQFTKTKKLFVCKRLRFVSPNLNNVNISLSCCQGLCWWRGGGIQPVRPVQGISFWSSTLPEPSRTLPPPTLLMHKALHDLSNVQLPREIDFCPWDHVLPVWVILIINKMPEKQSSNGAQPNLCNRTTNWKK